MRPYTILSPETFSPLSFRDPDGRVYIDGDRVLRSVRKQASEAILSFIHSDAAQRLIRAKKLIGSQLLADVPRASPDEDEMWLRHDKVSFASFPFEWAPEMLHAAALLTLEISEVAFHDGYELKDATPFNVLFRGSQPVFIDVASIRKFAVDQAAWHAHAQFAQTFLFPLLAHRLTGQRIDSIFLNNRDGLTVREMKSLAGLWRSSVGRRLVLLSTWLEKWSRGATTGVRRVADPDAASFIRRSLYRRLRKDLLSLSPSLPPPDDVTEYSTDRSSQEAEQTDTKQRVASDWLRDLKPGRVLDVGANSGDYSFLAAAQGASVVAIDRVPAAVSILWCRVREKNADILPLLVDLGRPTPATGWRNEEHASFLERAKSHFDAVLFLAVLHHIVINERAPLESLFQLLAGLTRDALIIEFVSREDANFKLVARGRDALFDSYTVERFEETASHLFTIQSKVPLPGGTRTLYLMRKRYQ